MLVVPWYANTRNTAWCLHELSFHYLHMLSAGREANICMDIGDGSYQIFLSRRACMTRQAKTPRFAESTTRHTPPIHMLHIEVALCLKRAVLESCMYQIV